jgi:heat shock protein HspQ
LARGGASPTFSPVEAQEVVNRRAKFRIGQVVRHRVYPFRGVIFDVDPTFSNTEEWWLSIPAEVRPRKDQPFYHLLAENEQSTYVAYVSEQNLLPDESGPVRHPQVKQLFGRLRAGCYEPKLRRNH